MPITEKSMRFLLSDALRGYSQKFRLLSDANPYAFELNDRRYSAHASIVHFAARANPDEWRIQVPRNVRALQEERSRAGYKVLFLGFFDEFPTFTGWEAEYLFSMRSNDMGTVYVPQSQAALAEKNLAALDRKPALNLGRQTAKVTLRNEFLGFYVENADACHASRSQDELERAVGRLAEFVEKAGAVGDVSVRVDIGGERRIVTLTRVAFARDPAFRDAVLKAYSGTCCVCGRQLGLVQAAHIIPHSHPDCTQGVVNGLALCVEHHKLYDDALLLPSSGQHFHLNEDRVEHLRNIGQDSGIDAIRALAATQYRVPEHVPSRPRDDYLDRGVRIRLGTDA